MGDFLSEELRVGCWGEAPVCAADGLVLWNQIPQPLPAKVPDLADDRARFHAWLNLKPIEFKGTIISSFAMVSIEDKLYYVSSGQLCFFPSAWSRFNLEKTRFLHLLQHKERPNVDANTIKMVLGRAEKHLPRGSPILEIRHEDLYKTFTRSGLSGQQFDAMLDEGPESEAFMKQLGWPDHANMRIALRFATAELNREKRAACHAVQRKRAREEAKETDDEQEYEQEDEQEPAAGQSQSRLRGCPQLSNWLDKETPFLKVMPEQFKPWRAERPGASGL
jgi:hypothetical protein